MCLRGIATESRVVPGPCMTCPAEGAANPEPAQAARDRRSSPSLSPVRRGLRPAQSACAGCHRRTVQGSRTPGRRSSEFRPLPCCPAESTRRPTMESTGPRGGRRLGRNCTTTLMALPVDILNNNAELGFYVPIAAISWSAETFVRWEVGQKQPTINPNRTNIEIGNEKSPFTAGHQVVFSPTTESPRWDSVISTVLVPKQ
jgi:hypothetical protein